MADDVRGPVEKAVRRDLSRVKALTLAPALAQSAIKIAQTMDGTSAARDLATLARELRNTLAEVAQLAVTTQQQRQPAASSPAEASSTGEASAVDELATRRASRRSAAAAQ